MPKVEVNYFPTSEMKILALLRPRLASIVAAALHAEENPKAHLTPEDIEINFRPYGNHDIVGKYDFAVTVFANDYPERRADLEKVRVPQIESAVREIMGDGLNFFVWVLLGVGGFVEHIANRE
jgi:hypothetical protein